MSDPKDLTQQQEVGNQASQASQANQTSPTQDHKDNELSQSRGELIEKLEDQMRVVTADEISDILNTTIIHDVRNKKINFLTMLLTYTEQDQINVSYNADSSTGKSYIPLELAWYFPKEDIIEYGYVSPTAFFHEYGTMIVDPSDMRDVEDEKKHKIIEIDLHQKILIFLDQPHDLLLQRLRPLLSHDRKTIVAKITDRRKVGSLTTKTVIIKGYPTVLFCTAKFSMEDQERTRLLLLSPEVTKEKIKDSILLKTKRDSNRKAFAKFMESDPERLWLLQRVQAIKSAHIEDVIIPEELGVKIGERFFKMHENLIPRHQRDIGRLLALIKAHAVLNLWHRERIDNTIVANESDMEDGMKLYSEVSMANELGLPPEVFNIFVELAGEISEKGVTKKMLRAIHYKKFHRVIGQKRLDEVLALLGSVGLLADEQDPDHRTQKLFLLTPQGVLIAAMEKKKVEHGDGINTPPPVSNFEDLAKETHEMHPIKQLTEGKCCACNVQGKLGFQLFFHNGEVDYVCESCGMKMRELLEKNE